MKSHACNLLLTVGLAGALGGASAIGQTGRTTVEAHVAAAKAAAGQEHTALFNRLCTEPAPAPSSPPSQPPAEQPQGPSAHSQWYAEPVKVFDNLYFVGQTEYSAWAVTTSDGIIVVDALWDYSVEDEIVGGLKKLGTRSDHDQIRPGNPWSHRPCWWREVSPGSVRRTHHPGGGGLGFAWSGRPRLAEAKRDMVATDGQRLTLGDTTLILNVTRGHTLGTVSPLIPVKDGGRPHVAAEWGGTGFNWLQQRARARYITPERPDRFWFETYIKSADRFRDIVAKAGADVLISNHTNYDGSKTKLLALAKRKPGDPHPYIVGNDSVKRYLTVAEECAKAGLLRLK